MVLYRKVMAHIELMVPYYWHKDEIVHLLEDRIQSGYNFSDPDITIEHIGNCEEYTPKCE